MFQTLFVFIVCLRRRGGGVWGGDFASRDIAGVDNDEKKVAGKLNTAAVPIRSGFHMGAFVLSLYLGVSQKSFRENGCGNVVQICAVSFSSSNRERVLGGGRQARGDTY